MASMAMSMMDEGTSKMSSLEINEKLQVLGASIGSYSDLDASYVSMNTLKPTLDASLDLYADIILNPAFPEAEFERTKSQQLAQIEREKATPIQMALRVFPKFLYGDNHAYSLPMTGSGLTKTVSSMTRDEMVSFYDTWIHPNNATLVVVGDIGMDELADKLESRFGKWKKGKTPTKNMATVAESHKGKLFLMDRPESQQSVIIGGYLTEGYGKVDEIAREAMNNVLGGQFTSRINMNLREDKHWAYGAGSIVWNAKGQRPYISYAPVQTDKTKESVEEIIKEYRAFIGDSPVTQEEFDKNQNNTIMSLPGQWETNGAVAGSVVNVCKYGLDQDYNQKYDQMVRGLTLAQVHKVANQMVHPDELAWFVVGDREKVLPGLKELGFKEIILIDSDGNPIEKVEDVGP